MNLSKQIRDLLEELNMGRMSITAYDTAWMARLAEIGEPIGDLALNWLREHQLSDGSWGATRPYYSHDRIVSTLAAINALARRAYAQDRILIQRAEAALHKAFKNLELDQSGATVGFELIVPTLFSEGKALGALHNQENEIIQHLTPLRAAKLAVLPHKMISRFVSTAFSAEMAGIDRQQLLDVENLQEIDGSIGCSPSATAYYALYVRRRDKAALCYLNHLSQDGTAPNAFPIDIFERTVVFWNLALILDVLDDEHLTLCHTHLDDLKAAWIPGKGVGFSRNYASTDGDDTSILFEVLNRFGYSVDVEAILYYEQPFQFRCYDFETSPSVSANIHVLSALRQFGWDKETPTIQKLLVFLEKTRVNNRIWFDKWHTSPYYSTCHAIIACTGYGIDDLIEPSVVWLLETQNADGSWGYTMPTAEETAYSLQALSIWNRHEGTIPQEVFRKGKIWLTAHADPPYPALWIAKCLYCPELIVRSVILSALVLTEQV